MCIRDRAYIQWAALNPYSVPVTEAAPEEEPAAPVWGGPQNPETLSVPELVPSAVQAAQAEEAADERLNGPGSDVPPDPGAVGPTATDSGDATTKNPFTTTFWKQNPLGLGARSGDPGEATVSPSPNGETAGSVAASEATVTAAAAVAAAATVAATAEGAGAADAQPDGQPQAPEGRGTHTEIADHVEPDADADDHADADQGDPGGHDTNGKGSHNGKGARSKKRAKTT